MVAIVYARFDPGRYFCWAPHDAQNEYRIEVVIDGRPLDRDAVLDRYRTLTGWDPRAIEHVKRVIVQYESTRGSSDAAVVTLHYKINGIEQEAWRWPKP